MTTLATAGPRAYIASILKGDSPLFDTKQEQADIILRMLPGWGLTEDTLPAAIGLPAETVQEFLSHRSPGVPERYVGMKPVAWGEYGLTPGSPQFAPTTPAPTAAPAGFIPLEDRVEALEAKVAELCGLMAI